MGLFEWLKLRHFSMQRHTPHSINTSCSSNVVLTHKAHLRTSALSVDDDDDDKRKRKKEEPTSLLSRFRALWRQYWYVVLPVHIVTSLGWFTGFYYVVVRCVDDSFVSMICFFSIAVVLT